VSTRQNNRLILISGAVASGKTTLASLLAAKARATGVPAASIDMDALTEMVGGPDWSHIADMHRRLACELAADIAQRLFARAYRLIAIAGSTVSSREWQQVLRDSRPTQRTTRVLLRVSVAEASRRARDDGTRGVTRNSTVLAQLHAAIDWSDVPEPDICLDTDGLSQDEVAETVWVRLGDPGERI
jgi:adenylylsulfate kinase-like enzyme